MRNTGSYSGEINFVIISLVSDISVGVFLFSFLCLIGSATFAAGAFLRNTAAMLPVMLLGRLLFGSGNGSLSSGYIRFVTA